MLVNSKKYGNVLRIEYILIRMKTQLKEYGSLFMNLPCLTIMIEIEWRGIVEESINLRDV